MDGLHGRSSLDQIVREVAGTYTDAPDEAQVREDVDAALARFWSGGPPRVSIAYYHELLADTSRIRSFRTAITNQVGAGDTVLEVGTGLGTFAQFAARAGASHVWAVDADPVVHVAEALAQANDQTERITWLRGWVPKWTSRPQPPS